MSMTPQSSEVWSQGDDWTEVSTTKERRKRQNHIHQRAYRKRRHLKNFSSDKPIRKCTEMVHVDTPGPGACPPPEHPADTRRYQSQLFIAMLDSLPIMMAIKCPERNNMKDFLQRAFTNWGLNFPTIRDLPLVTCLNTVDALARNALALRIPFEYLETDNHNSLFNVQGPQPVGETPAFPPHLLPTQLQKAITHHSWLDLIPIPGMRDNFLRGIDAGEYNEDYLCEALVCDLLDFETDTKSSLVVWGESWDANGWEFGAEFFRKWDTLLQGCPGVSQATNYWCEKRGEMKIGFVLN